MQSVVVSVRALIGIIWLPFDEYTTIISAACLMSMTVQETLGRYLLERALPVDAAEQQVDTIPELEEQIAPVETQDTAINNQLGDAEQRAPLEELLLESHL